MKKLFILFAILFPLVVNAMKIEKNELDEFTGARTVITSWESFKTKSIYIRFRLQEGVQYLDFKYISGGAIVIPNEGKLMFKATNGDIVQFSSIALFTGGKGEGSINIIGSGAWGIFANYIGDINWFVDHSTMLVRLYSTDGYKDFKISEKEGQKLQELATLFLTTISK